MTEEDFLRQQITDLQRSYQEDLRPYVERLAVLYGMQLRPMYIDVSQDPPNARIDP